VVLPLRFAQLRRQFFDFDAALVNERAQFDVSADEVVDIVCLTGRKLLHCFLQTEFDTQRGKQGLTEAGGMDQWLAQCSRLTALWHYIHFVLFL